MYGKCLMSMSSFPQLLFPHLNCYHCGSKLKYHPLPPTHTILIRHINLSKKKVLVIVILVMARKHGVGGGSLMLGGMI